MTRKIQDDVADATTTAFEIHANETTVWVSAGTANVVHDGTVLLSLAVDDPREVLDGFPYGEVVYFVSTSANTTSKATP